MECYKKNLTLFLNDYSYSGVIAAAFMIKVIKKRPFCPVFEENPDETDSARQR
jgi:hypothetical protein